MECNHNTMLVGPPARCADCGYRYGIDDKRRPHNAHDYADDEADYRISQSATLSGEHFGW